MVDTHHELPFTTAISPLQQRAGTQSHEFVPATFHYSQILTWLMMLPLVFHRRSELASFMKANFDLYFTASCSFVLGLQVSNLIGIDLYLNAVK